MPNQPHHVLLFILELLSLHSFLVQFIDELSVDQMLLHRVSLLCLGIAFDAINDLQKS